MKETRRTNKRWSWKDKGWKERRERGNEGMKEGKEEQKKKKTRKS